MPSIDEKTARLLTERHFREAGEWAISCLEAGFDSKHLRILAATLPNEWPSVTFEIERKALAELSWDRIHRSEYMLGHARSLARDMLEGRVDMIDGSRRIYQLMYEADLSDELGAWYDIDEIISSRSYYESHGTKDYFYRESDELEMIIREACEGFLRASRHKIAPLPETSFEEAEIIFGTYLADHDLPSEVRWVFAEDMIVAGNILQLYLPQPDENRVFARRLYGGTVRPNLGLELRGFAVLGALTLAYIIAPEDEFEASRMMLGPRFVKFSAYTHRYTVNQIDNPFLWKIKNLLTNDKKRIGYEDSMPFKTGNHPG